MGQQSSNCCTASPNIGGEMMLQIKKMVDQKENKLPQESIQVNTNMMLLAKEEEMLQCTKVEQPILLAEVEQALTHKSNLNIPIQYERGVFQDGFFRFHKTGVIYYGEWKVVNPKSQRKVPNGYGTNYYPNGNYFEGTFVEGTPHGYGRLINSQGQHYEGEVKYGRANGSGMYDNKFLFYKGDFKDNQKHGKGCEKSHDGIYYFQGNFEYDQKEKGILRYGKVTYEGGFLDNLYHGEGKLTNEQGIYRGKFKQGKQHGYGEFQWVDGSSYKGEFKDGVKEGQGEYYNSKDFTIAKGYWKNNKLNGNGVYTDTFGNSYSCIWENNKIKQILDQ